MAKHIAKIRKGWNGEGPGNDRWTPVVTTKSMEGGIEIYRMLGATLLRVWYRL